MATQSTDDQNKTQGQELGLGKNEDPQDARTEDAKVSSSGSPFVNSEPIREDQVQNAVKFLSHPKVRGSPVMYRRSFLEKKGLTKEEIDEAFRRVPDPSPDAQAPNNNLDTKMGFPSKTQLEALHVAAPSGVVSTIGTRKQYLFHWSHAIFGIGFIATCSAGTVILVKRVVIPRLKSWIRKIVKEEENGLQPSLAEQTAAAAKAAAAAAADMARVSHELLDSKIQVSSFCAELRNVLDFQLQEMKAMTGALSSLQGQANNSVTATSFSNSLMQQQQQPYANGKTDSYTRTASAEPSVAPHPPSYMEILSMVQRGEKPPNVKDIDDSPPNPNQQISDPRLAPRMKPWEVGPTQKTNPSATPMHNTQGNGNGFYSQPQVDTSIPWWQRKNSTVVQQVEVNGEEQSNVTQKSLQPVQRRWVPPQPPPVVMPEAAEAIKRPKPSANKAEVGLVADNQLVRPSSDAPDSSNTAIISSEELSSNGVTNTELKSNEIQGDGEQTRAPVVMPEAAEAIKRPNPSANKGEGDLGADNQLVPPSSDAPDSSNTAIISSEELSSKGVTNTELKSNEILGDDEQTRAPVGLEA